MDRPQDLVPYVPAPPEPHTQAHPLFRCCTFEGAGPSPNFEAAPAQTCASSVPPEPRTQAEPPILMLRLCRPAQAEWPLAQAAAPVQVACGSQRRCVWGHLPGGRTGTAAAGARAAEQRHCVVVGRELGGGRAGVGCACGGFGGGSSGCACRWLCELGGYVHWQAMQTSE